MTGEKTKWIAIGVIGSLFALSHIGMIGMLAKKESKFPQINVPVGDYTSYNVMAGKDGYSTVSYTHLTLPTKRIV